MSMLLMYASELTPRLQYIVKFFSGELFDRPVRLTSDRQQFLAHQGPKLNYSSAELCGEEFFLVPVPLLFETDIRTQRIDCFEINFHTVFFETKGDLHFDIFAASFYLLSRYEEYLPHEKDRYGRYAHTNSLAWRQKFLHQPLVNIWLQQFRDALQARFPDLVFRGKQFSCLITYDIDMAYSYLCKGLLRNLGGTLRSLLKGEWGRIAERWQVLLGRRKDPFDCFEWLDALHLYCRLQPYYFFLVAGKRGAYDKNISTSARPFHKLVEYYAGSYPVGLHPSWQSGDDFRLLKEELQWLEAVAGREIAVSRQHYLRFTLPGGYRRLLEAGITKDFSMGYGMMNGFRASVASCFNWFDLERNEETPLEIYPFCFMDSNSYYALGQTPQQAYAELVSFYEAVKRVNGLMIGIWHNNLLGSDRSSIDWSRMFELFMRETVYWDAYADGGR